MNFTGIWATIFICFMWFGGFLWFVIDIPSNPPCPECTTDAIVVLTGGNNRIASAFDLLDQRLSNHLLISGVKPGTTLEKIKKNSGFKGEIANYKISLDDQSRSTKENAVYTLKWLKKYDHHSIRLVTANYHMQRSLLEFQNVMPEVLIVPHPISSQDARNHKWYTNYKTFGLLLNEYNKYLGAFLRLKVKSLVNMMK